MYGYITSCLERTGHAVGTDSASSSFRRSSAPAGAWATPFVSLLLLKKAYASSLCPDSSRSGSTHSASSSSVYVQSNRSAAAPVPRPGVPPVEADVGDRRGRGDERWRDVLRVDLRRVDGHVGHPSL